MIVTPTLPVDHLSKSSIDTYLKCPERWRRRYLEHEQTPSSAALVLGAAVSNAITANYQQKIESGRDIAVSDALDLYLTGFDEKVQTDEVVWHDDKPDKTKDLGARIVKKYHVEMAPKVMPVSAEREIDFRFAGAQWRFTGYIDWEDNAGLLFEMKTAKQYKPADLILSTDSYAYLAARRAEGNPALAMVYHSAIKTQDPRIETTTVIKSDAMLDRWLRRLATIANEIQWRTESGNWAGAAPGAWWCAEKWCGYWTTCPMGGKP